MKRMSTLFLACWCLSTPAVADTITLSSGRVITCKVLHETADTVTITEDPDAADIVTFGYPRASVTDIQRDPAIAGPTYMEIPIQGVFGEEITAQALEDALAAARERSVTYVIFLVDSGGGRVDELDKIITVMGRSADLHTVAFVKRAYSAAAIFAGSCRNIVMYPGGQIGAALPYKAKDGMPIEVKEKLTSATRALARSAAQAGGHNPRIFEAMVDPNMEVTLGPTGPTIKPRGKILCLNDAEAVALGLASGDARTIGDVRRALSLQQWSPAGQRGRRIMEKYARAATLKADYNSRAVPQINAIRDRMLDRQNQVTSLQTKLKELQSAHSDALLSIDRDHQNATAEALRTLDAEHNLARVIENRQTAIDSATQSFEESQSRIIAKLKSLVTENEADAQRAREILEAAPR